MSRIRCTICAHHERARAEMLLAKGDGYTEVAKRLGLSVDALERHWKRHTSEEYREAMAPGSRALAARHELIAQLAEDTGSTRDNLKASRAVAWQGVVQELQACNTTKLAIILAQHTKICATIARIDGELAASPMVQQTHYHQHQHFTADPEFVCLMREVAEALGPYPEARRAALARFAALDAMPIEDEPLPQITDEHHSDAAAESHTERA
jgi:hypothetical protein